MGTTTDIPAGWDFNPSRWSQRLPIIGLAVIGFLIALYLALYQWRVSESVWEPFFGEGSRKILNSGISRILPIPDAALGAIGYLVDAVTGVIGRQTRWRTMPWMVILFGLAVGPLGAVSLLLVILQPVLFDSWCTLCLASAAISVLMIGPSMDELLASLQHIKQEKEKGHSAWLTFWGISPANKKESQKAETAKAREQRPSFGFPTVTPRVITAGFGLWLMTAHTVFGYGGAEKTNDVIVGALAVSISLIAIWEVMRPLRWLNFVLGIWLVTAPWVLNLEETARTNALIVGLLLAAFVPLGGKAQHRFGGGGAALWRSAGGDRRTESLRDLSPRRAHGNSR